MKERTKDLIRELHMSSCFNRSLEIEKEFPELFIEDALVEEALIKTITKEKAEKELGKTILN